MSGLRLNLGSSSDTHRKGYTCVDIAFPACVECGLADNTSFGGMTADLRERFPWDDSSVDEILAHDVAEHLGNGYRLNKIFKSFPVPGLTGQEYIRLLVDVEIIPFNGILHFFNECHRVMVPGGVLDLVVPCYPGIAPWCDPTHVAVYTSDLRYYLTEPWSSPDPKSPKYGERGRLGPAYGITALFRTLPSSRSGVDWTPIQYVSDAPDRRKIFVRLQAVK